MQITGVVQRDTTSGGKQRNVRRPFTASHKHCATDQGRDIMLLHLGTKHRYYGSSLSDMLGFSSSVPIRVVFSWVCPFRSGPRSPGQVPTRVFSQEFSVLLTNAVNSRNSSGLIDAAVIRERLAGQGLGRVSGILYTQGRRRGPNEFHLRRCAGVRARCLLTGRSASCETSQASDPTVSINSGHLRNT